MSAVVTAFGLAVGWAGGQGGAVLLGLPLMVVAAGVAFVVQWFAFVPSYLKQTEQARQAPVDVAQLGRVRELERTSQVAFQDVRRRPPNEVITQGGHVLTVVGHR